MASRRQDAWEVKLKAKAFLTSTIKPIVDETTTFKHGASGTTNQLGGLAAGGNQATNQSTMAQRRQDAWELKLKEKAFLTSTIKPIVDETTTFKPPVPYVLREVKRGMDKGVYFKDNTYGLAGAPGVATMSSIYEYDNWDQ